LSISKLVDIVGGMDDIKILQAIAEPTRLAIVRQLASDGEVCACDFTDCCGVSQPTVSHHLKVLREAGVASGEQSMESAADVDLAVRQECVLRDGGKDARDPRLGEA